MKLTMFLLLSAPLGAWAQSPGGVSSPSIWIKANDGTYSDAGSTLSTDSSTVAQWNDRSSNNKHLSQTTSSERPLFLNGSTLTFNYNPAVKFSSHHLNTVSADGLFQNAAIYNNIHMFSVHHNLNSGNPSVVCGEGDNSVLDEINSVGMGYLPSLSRAFGKVAETYLLLASSVSDIPNFATHVVGYSIGTGGNYGHANDQAAVMIANGKQVASSTTTFLGYTPGSAEEFYVGDRTAGDRPFSGYIGEVLVYTKALSNTEIKQVESYLAIKYGKTLDNSDGGTFGDYISSTGTTTLWDADNNSAYHNHVIGIGRDDGSGLLQKQSQQADDTTRIYISSLQATNAANTGSLSNGSFVMTGNNSGQMFSTGSTEYPTDQGIYSRLDREWKITNTGFTGTFSMDFKPKYTNVTASDLRVLVDADGDFSDATMYNPTITFNDGVITVIGIDNTMIPSGTTQYLTLVSLDVNTPLPVSLISFNAKTAGPTVELNWQTASEVNNAFFAVERSANGVQWEQVAQVTGAGNSSQLQDYSYADSQPLNGVSYYRLKQVNIDGTYKYSPVNVVRVEATQTSIEIYPNPVSDQLIIKGNQEDVRKLKLFDVMGRELTQKMRVSSRSNDQTVINMAAMSKGLYIFVINGISYKVIKE